MSICKYCNKHYIDPVRPNSTQCNSCTVSKRRRKNKQKYVEYLGGKCSRCNFNENIAALQFHHLRNKSFNINSNKLLLKEEIVKEELNKCILLCANCHAIEHSNYKRFE